jgi:hypothetical protein
VKQFIGTICGRSCFFNCYNSGLSGWVLLRVALPLHQWTLDNCPPGATYEICQEFAYERKRFRRGVLPPATAARRKKAVA